MTRPVLYTFRRCPYAIRARLALAVAGVEVEPREVDLRDKPAELRAASPKATVPVLQLPDGRVIDESLAIMRWALGRHDPQGWLAAAPADAQDALVRRNDEVFKPLLDGYKYFERHPSRSREAWREAAVESHLGPLDGQLAGHAQVFGARPSLADAALLPFVRQFAMADPAWFAAAPLPSLRGWLERWLAAPLFAAVMARHPPWRA